MLADPLLQLHNSHQTAGIDYFQAHDPQLRRLSQCIYQYEFPLMRQLPCSTPGVYTVGGGRQIGKSTLVKQWMLYLLTEKQVPARNITFLTGDIIDDYHQLIQLITQILAANNDNTLTYVIIDEVTYIKDWDRGIKFLADASLLNQVVLLLTGSDLTMIQEARMRFPGRRGRQTKWISSCIRFPFLNI